MKDQSAAERKMLDRDQLRVHADHWRSQGLRIVFTNGCFDILHRGHLQLLKESAGFGDILVVGLNTDGSVRKLKGDQRPVNDEDFRCLMMASLELVDAVTLFDEETPLELIRALQPDVLVKGGDYTADQVVGAEEVMRSGGEVRIVPLVRGYSTTALIEAIHRL